jgi:hypothetical protein
MAHIANVDTAPLSVYACTACRQTFSPISLGVLECQYCGGKIGSYPVTAMWFATRKDALGSVLLTAEEVEQHATRGYIDVTDAERKLIEGA